MASLKFFNLKHNAHFDPSKVPRRFRDAIENLWEELYIFYDFRWNMRPNSSILLILQLFINILPNLIIVVYNF